MRHLFYYISILILASLTISCEKLDEDRNHDINNKVTLCASVNNNKTKTCLGSKDENNLYPILWSENDAIAVINNGKLFKFIISNKDAGKSEGIFICNEGDGFDANEDIVAYYPYEAVTYDNGKITCSIQQEQLYVESNFKSGAVPMSATRKSGDNGTLTFNNPFGILKLQLKGTSGEYVNSISVTSSTDLCGEASLNSIDGSLCLNSTDRSKKLLLKCETPVSINTSKEFLIVVPAGNYKFSVSIITTKNTYVKSTASSKEIKPGVILKMAEIDITNTLPAYIDQDGINHGNGIKINNLIWAPVNCGYNSVNYPYGKLYQWGRKDGGGYNDGDVHNKENQQIVQDKPFSWNGTGDCLPDPDNFYIGTKETEFDWLTSHHDNLWNSGTASSPVKTKYDPCPTGWRVPTSREFKDLYDAYDISNDNCSDFIEYNGQKGRWYTGKVEYSENVPEKIFLPAAGHIGSSGTPYYRSFNNKSIHETGSYWTSDPHYYDNRYRAYSFVLAEGYTWMIDSDVRAQAMSIRCVRE